MVRMVLTEWQPNGKTHFTEKSGKNMVNTSNNGPSSNTFKIWSFTLAENKQITNTLTIHKKKFKVIILDLQGSEPENESMS